MTEAAETTRRSRVRGRNRQLDTADAPSSSTLSPEAEKQVRDLSRTVYAENNLMNRHKRTHDKARKDLYKLCLDEGLTHVDVNTSFEGNRKTLDVDLVTPEGTGIDIVKLKSLVPEETFMKIVSATQTAVKEFAGQIIVDQCSFTTKGNQNVVVKEKK